MAPVALLAVWYGAPAFSILAAVLGGVMVWEWDRMCRGRFGPSGRAVAAGVVVAALVAPVAPLLALGMVWTGCLAAAVFSRSGWLAMGALYIGLPVVAMVWLRDVGGAWTLIWTMVVVWGTDTGAYAAGRAIGGPRLAPRISPNKTWAGLLGGMVSAAVLGGLAAVWLDPDRWLPLAALAAGLAVVAQLGDLFESSVKRRFKVKDSSRIIPGHGGVLDRVDGLMAAAPVVALVVASFGGGVEIWR
jgi:phosphatidate cytidylyltransferase